MVDVAQSRYFLKSVICENIEDPRKLEKLKILLIFGIGRANMFHFEN
jgi:hypothetical protein